MSKKSIFKLVIIDILILALLFGVSLACYNFYIKPLIHKNRSIATSWDDKYDGHKDKDYLCVNSNTTIVQNLTMPVSKCSGISFYILNNASKSKDFVEIEFKRGNYIEYSKTISVSSFSKDGYLYVPFGKTLNFSAGDKYNIIIKSNEIAKPFYLMTSNRYSFSKNIIVDGNKQSRSLCYQLNYGDVSDILNYCILLFVVISLLVLMISFIVYYNVPITKSIIPIIMSVGILFSLVSAPFTQPDDYKHYSTVYYITNKILDYQSKSIKNGNTVGYYDSSLYLIDNFKKPNINNYVNNYRGLIGSEEYKVPSDYRISLAKPLSNSFISYIPQILGVLLGRIIGFNSFLVYLLGRLFALLFFAIFIYLSIKIIPFGKSIILTISILPIMLQQVTSFSYDVVLISIIIILMSYYFNISFSDDYFTLKNFIIIFVLSVIIAIIKPNYLLINLLWILIPSDKFKYSWHKWAILCLVIIASALIGLGFNTFLINSVLDSRHGRYFNGRFRYYYSFVDIIKYPFRFFKLLFNTIYNYGSIIFSSMICNNIGWESYTSPFIYISLYTIILVLSIFDNTDIYKYKISLIKKQKVVSIIINIICLISIFVIMYTGCTFRGNSYIAGIQGRYILPILPLLLLSLIPVNIKTKINSTKITVITSIVNVFFVISLVLFNITNEII